VAHIYNLSYLRSGDEEDIGLRPAQAKSTPDTISTNKKLVVVPVIPHIYEA
jgi:hypothetical protein